MSVHKLPRRRPELTTERDKARKVAERIRQMILTDELSAGQAIRERTLAEELGVSRTPLREALKILAGEGIVDLSPDRGATVAVLRREEVFQLIQVLGAIEGIAGEFACAAITEAQLGELSALHFEMLACRARNDRLGYFNFNQLFHSNIVQASGNQILFDHYKKLNMRVYKYRFIVHRAGENWDVSTHEHEEIIDYLKNRNSAALVPLMRSHILKIWDDISDRLEEDGTVRPI